MLILNTLVSIPSPANPSCLQATAASFSPQLSPHTGVHTELWQYCTSPSEVADPLNKRITPTCPWQSAKVFYWNLKTRVGQLANIQNKKVTNNPPPSPHPFPPSPNPFLPCNHILLCFTIHWCTFFFFVVFFFCCVYLSLIGLNWPAACLVAWLKNKILFYSIPHENR